jgi:CPA1 family monovalent cation:H+ antiporter
MGTFNILSFLLVLAALFSYINHRYFRLPGAIALMSFSLLFSFTLIVLGKAGLPFLETARAVLDHLDFGAFVLHGVLSFLLFAGAMRADLNDLLTQKRVIILLATLGVVLSTLLVGCITWGLLSLIGLHMPLIYCLMFGALISPTDPVAVLSLLKSLHLQKGIHIKIMGESLFNDGMAVVVFLFLLGISVNGTVPGAVNVADMLLREIGGGALFGLVCGVVAYQMLQNMNDAQVAIIITLALVSGCYALADAWHLSGPIAVVVAGLIVGNRLTLARDTRNVVDGFWELLDGVLNALLFMLMGLEILVMPVTWHHLVIGLLLVPVVLAARFVSVGVPVILLKPFNRFPPNAVRILTWGGLRGGISVAMALSLPLGPYRGTIISITYAVVIFSVLVQGLTLKKIAGERPRNTDMVAMEKGR